MIRPVFAFDIDGVVVDSEAVHTKALQKIVGEISQAVPSEALIGLSLEETLHKIGFEGDQSEGIGLEIERAYIDMINVDHLRPDIVDTLQMLHDLQYPFGFVSSASRQVCEANLRLVGNADSYPLVSRDDVVQTKPHAEPYLALCKLLGAPPADTIAIEDSDIGMAAAHSAGIRKIYGWPHGLSSGQTYRLCSKKISTLSEIEEIETIRALVTPK